MQAMRVQVGVDVRVVVKRQVIKTVVKGETKQSKKSVISSLLFATRRVLIQTR
jgi:hypothetical protein